MPRKSKGQHFLLTAAARSISLAAVMRMSEVEAWAVFQRLRWPSTDGKPVCPHCGTLVCYDISRDGRPLYRCKE